LKRELNLTLEALVEIESWPANTAKVGRDALEAGARRFAFSLARTSIAALLLEAAATGVVDIRVVQRWCRKRLVLI
jgi:hypothetical protein